MASEQDILASPASASHQLIPMVSITDAADQLGVTQRAIRYYEAVGMVTASRDRRNARCFGPDDRLRLTLICRLRRAGVSVPVIRDLLRRVDPGARAALAIAALRQREARLSTEIDYVRQALRELV